MQNNNSNKKIAKNSFYLSLRMVIVLAISLYTTRIILQALGVIDYGIYNVVCGFVSLFAFLNNSMSNGIQRFFNFEFGRNNELGANTVYCTSLIIQTVLGLIVVVIIELVGLWYLYNEMVIPEDRLFAAAWVFHFSVVSFFVGIIQAPYMAAVIAHERLDFYAFVSVLDVLLKLGVIFLISNLTMDKLIAYGFLSSMIIFVDFILYYVYCKMYFKEIKFHFVWDKNLYQKMLGFSGWNLFGAFSLVMENQGINIVMNYFFGPLVNAARGVANQINGGVQSFVQNITMPVRPQVIQSYSRGDIGRTLSLTYAVSKISSAFLLIIALPTVLEVDFILQLWLGENVPSHTSTFTVLILLISLVNNLNAAISGIVHATGDMRSYQLWGSLVRVCSVPLSFVLFNFFNHPELGLLSVLISAILTHSVCMLIVKKLIEISPFDYFIKVVVPIFIAIIVSLICLLPVYFFVEEGLVKLILTFVMSVFVVSLIFFHIALDENEKQLTLEIIKPFYRKILVILNRNVND